MLERDNKIDNAMSTPSTDGKVTKTKTSRGATTTRKKKTSKSNSTKKASYKIVSRSSTATSAKKKTTRKKSTTRSKAKSASTAPKAGLGARSPLQEAARPRMVSAAERLQMIAKAAYHLATGRGFHTSDPRQNWIDAEAEVDSMLAEGRGTPAD